MDALSSLPGTRAFARLASSLLLVVAAAACGHRGAPPDAPSIVLISIDTLRRDHVSAYGYERETTPRIDQTASEGALFLNAVSVSNWTLPSHMSLMTGLPPSLHRVEDDGSRLPASVMTLAEVLQQDGYTTAGVTSHVYLGEQFGFARGFDRYTNQWNKRAADVTDQAIAWLEEADDDPVFLFLHYFDPHWNFDPPEPFDARFGPADAHYGDIEYLKHHLDPANPLPDDVLDDVVRLYDGEIAYTDHEIGRLLDWLREKGRLDHTIFALVSDHGEEFGDHGGFGHGTHLYGEVTRIPFVLRYPKRVTPGERERLATLSDVPLTLLRLAGLPVPDQFRLRGVDLEAPISPERERIAFVESTRWGPNRFAVIDSTHKLLTPGCYSPVFAVQEDGQRVLKRLGPYPLEPALYDVAHDPAERENLAPSAASATAGAKLGGALTEYLDWSLQAVKLTFTGSATPADYTVLLRPDGAFVDEPFCLDGRAAFFLFDQTAPRKGDQNRAMSEAEERLTLRVGPDPVTVYLPLDEASRELFVRVERDGGQSYQASVALPAMGATAEVPLEGTDAPSCVLERTMPTLDASLEEVDLEDEDLERLHSLGYVR